VACSSKALNAQTARAPCVERQRALILRQILLHTKQSWRSSCWTLSRPSGHRLVRYQQINNPVADDFCANASSSATNSICRPAIDPLPCNTACWDFKAKLPAKPKALSGDCQEERDYKTNFQHCTRREVRGIKTTAMVTQRTALGLEHPRAMRRRMGQPKVFLPAQGRCSLF